MKLSNLKIDSAKLEMGAWVKDIPGLGDIALKVRGFGNTDYRQRRSELIAALPRARRNDVAALDAITDQLLAETILIDWKGVEGDDGKPVPYSAEKAAEVLADPDLLAFKDGVAYAAQIVGERDGAAIEADAGN